jgi:glycosyltransferase involved in cell wall biosynthesis
MSTAASLPPADRPLRLLRVIHTLRTEAGGPSESVRRSTEALLRLGHSVEVATADAPESAGASDSRASAPPFPLHALGPADAHGRGPRLAPWLRERRAAYDAVLVHGLWQYHGHAVSRALRGTPTPYLVFPHGMLDPWFRRAYPLKHFKKQLYWWWREARVLREAAAVCFTCEEERRLARGTFAPYRLREEVVAYGTADPDAAGITAADLARQQAAWLARCPEVAGDRPYLLFLGRIHEKKGLDALIDAHGRAASSAPHSTPPLVIAGPGGASDYGRAIRHRAEQVCPPGSVVWPGMLEGDAKWGALRGCEAFALTSHQENFGIAVAEALACGRPVLLSDKVNIWREILDDGAGLVRGDSAPEVEALLADWRTLPAERRAAMGGAARRCFLARFEIGRAASSLVETVRTALARHTASSRVSS